MVWTLVNTILCWQGHPHGLSWAIWGAKVVAEGCVGCPQSLSIDWRWLEQRSKPLLVDDRMGLHYSYPVYWCTLGIVIIQERDPGKSITCHFWVLRKFVGVTEKSYQRLTAMTQWWLQYSKPCWLINDCTCRVLYCQHRWYHVISYYMCIVSWYIMFYYLPYIISLYYVIYCYRMI